MLITRPWTLRIQQRRMADDEFWEFACHEGNHDDILTDQVSKVNAEKK